jgi:hypothetical protein
MIFTNPTYLGFLTHCCHFFAPSPPSFARPEKPFEETRDEKKIEINSIEKTSNEVSFSIRTRKKLSFSIYFPLLFNFYFLHFQKENL